MLPERVELDPGLIGANIAGARRRLGLNQTELARILGVSRPTLIAIESGQRAPSLSTLSKVAEALQVRVRDLASLPARDESALVRFRNPLRADDTATDAVDALVTFGRYYVLLESKVAKRRPRAVSPVSLEHVRDVEHSAEDIAVAERARLNLGDGPLLDLRSVLEQEVGILTFGLPQLAKTKIAGIFAYTYDLPLIGFNAAQDPRRQKWTLAHEYAHYLTNRFDAEITYLRRSRTSRARAELFADTFAEHFLMPGSGVARRFSELVGVGETVTVAHVVLLADQFRVSFQAMCERLESLDRIPRNTYAHVIERGFRPIEAERSLGIERKHEHQALYPMRFVYLLSVLHRRGDISEGDVAHYLQTDRLSAREVLDTVENASAFPLDEALEEAL